MNVPGGGTGQVQYGPTGLYVVRNGLAMDVPKEKQGRIIDSARPYGRIVSFMQPEPVRSTSARGRLPLPKHIWP